MDSTNSNSLEEELARLHLALITAIADNVDDKSREGNNFLFQIKTILGPGIFSGYNSIVEQIAALKKKKNIIELENYENLKRICRDSGNHDFIKIIEYYEEKMREVRSRYQQKRQNSVDDVSSRRKSSDIESSKNNDILTQVTYTCNPTDQQQSDTKDKEIKRKAAGEHDQVPHKKGNYDEPQSTSNEEPTRQIIFETEEERNWVNIVLGINLVRDVLVLFCEEIIKEQHRTMLHKIQQKCNSYTMTCNLCKIKTLKPDHNCTCERQCPLGFKKCNCLKPNKTLSCPNNICGAIYSEIIKLHTQRSPNFQNTDIQAWCTDPCSIAKCFVSYRCNWSSLQNVDMTLLLQIITNCKSFTDKISDMDPCYKVRDIRNKIAHSSPLRLSSSASNAYLKILIDLLNIPEIRNIERTSKALEELDSITTGNTELIQCHVALGPLRRELRNIETQTDNYSYKHRSHCRRNSFFEEKYNDISGEIIPEELNTDPYKRHVHEESIKGNETEEDEVRVLVLGSHGEEKTLLVRKLLGQDCKNLQPTDGMEVHNCIVKPNGEWEMISNGSYTKDSLEIWDVGGNFVNYATHQVFLSTCAIYIIVFDLKKGLDACVGCNCDFGKHSSSTVRDNISLWVNSIHTFVGTKDGKSPPIIIVGIQNDEKQQESTKTFDEIMSLFRDNYAINHIHQKLICVSNTIIPTSTGLNELRSLINDFRLKLRKRISRRWKELANEIKILSKNKTIITINELLDIEIKTNSQNYKVRDGMDSNEFKVFLTYQHERAGLCYFDVSDYVILDPMLLVTAFKQITLASDLYNQYPINQKWNDLQETGIIHQDIFDLAWNSYTSDKKDLLLKFLKEYHIIADVRGTSSKASKYYFIPSFLNSSLKNDTKNAFLVGKTTSEVSLRYEDIPQKVIPILFNRIVAALVSKWPICNFQKKRLIFDNFAACKPRSDHAVVLLVVENGIELLTVNLKCKEVCSKICDEYRRFVESTIKEHVHELYFRTGPQKIELLKIAYRCRHLTHENKGSVQKLCDFKTLKENVPCPDHENHDIKPEYIQKWFPAHEKNEPVNNQTRKLTEEEYSKLSQSIDGNVHNLSEELGICYDAFWQIENDYISQQDQIYHLLLTWDRQFPELATFANLVKVLEQTNIKVDWDEIKNIENDE